MTDEQYKISILIRDAVFDNGNKTSVIGHYAHKAREIVEEAEQTKEQRLLMTLSKHFRRAKIPF